jgi:hypothetical protein
MAGYPVQRGRLSGDAVARRATRRHVCSPARDLRRHCYEEEHPYDSEMFGALRIRTRPGLRR